MALPNFNLNGTHIPANKRDLGAPKLFGFIIDLTLEETGLMRRHFERVTLLALRNPHFSGISLRSPRTIGLSQDLTHLFNQLHWPVWFLNESSHALGLKLGDCLLLVVSA